MISQSESGLTAGDYSELKALQDGATYQMTLQRINLTWALLNGNASTNAFDACATANKLIRIYLSGTSITVQGSTGGAWGTLATFSGLTDPGPLAVFGEVSTIRVFYEDNGTAYYRESTNEGGSFGSAQAIGVLSNIAAFAPTSLTKLHVTTYDGYNTRLRYYSYSGSWSRTDSSIYYPGQFDGLDAETIDGRDVLVFAARGPVRYSTCQQGIWAIRQYGGKWSDPLRLDVLDEYTAGEEQRIRPRCSLAGSLLFCTFLATDAGYKRAAYSRTAGGQHWEHRQPMGALNFEGKLITLGNYTYFIGSGLTYRSASTVIVGNSTVETDVTSRVGDYSASRQRTYGSTIVLHNEDGGLDLTGNNRWQVKEELGYFAGDGDPLLVQVALTEADTITHQRSLPAHLIRVSARDRMAWLMDRTEADHYEERESQLRHWDDFENTVTNADNKVVLNSGLRYTASMDGYWSTDGNILSLRSNNKEGLSLCTIDKFIAHTVVQEAIKVPTSGNNEWAGVVFRALDEDNYWCAYYDQASDKVKLRQKRAGDWQSAVAESSALSWSVGTWYYIRVEARLSLFRVYTSTDGRTWTQRISYVDQTMTAVRAAFQEGYVGHNGFGYSNEDYEPYEPPAYEPPYPTGTEAPGVYDQFFVGTDNGVAYASTDDVINHTVFSWTAFNGGLSNTDCQQLLYVQSLLVLYGLFANGLWWTGLPVSGASSWSQLVSAANVISVFGSGTSVTFKQLRVSWNNPLLQWMLVDVYDGSKHRPVFLTTTNGWGSFSAVGITYNELQDFPYSDHFSVARSSGDQTIFAITGYYRWGNAVQKSINGGTSWTMILEDGGWGIFSGACCPSGDDQYVSIGRNPSIDKLHLSINGGSSFSTQVAVCDTQQIHHRTGTIKMYMATDKDVLTFNKVTGQYASWWPGGQMWEEVDLWPNDARCVGWATDDELGYVVAVGTDYAASGPEVYHFDDYGNYRDITNNIQTVLSSASTAQCIGWEGGELIE